MKQREIYSNVKLQLNKEDGFISITEWNTLIPSLFSEFIRMKAEELFTITRAGALIPKSSTASKLLQQITKKTGLDFSPSLSFYTADLPADYLYWKYLYNTGTSRALSTEIELITEDEFMERNSNILAPQIPENPVALIAENVIYTYPGSAIADDGAHDDLVSSEFCYVRKPATPFLDYYIDANYKTRFMDATTAGDHTLTPGEEYRDGTTNLVKKVSQTVELEIPEDFHPEFQDLVIERLAMMIDDQPKAQYGAMKQAKEDAK
jgi:hypothetical protein